MEHGVGKIIRARFWGDYNMEVAQHHQHRVRVRKFVPGTFMGLGFRV